MRKNNQKSQCYTSNHLLLTVIFISSYMRVYFVGLAVPTDSEKERKRKRKRKRKRGKKRKNKNDRK